MYDPDPLDPATRAWVDEAAAKVVADVGGSIMFEPGDRGWWTPDRLAELEAHIKPGLDWAKRAARKLGCSPKAARNMAERVVFPRWRKEGRIA
jgi:ABC-type proline/glycine betaine transport system substrate-binding protein